MSGLDGKFVIFGVVRSCQYNYTSLLNYCLSWRHIGCRYILDFSGGIVPVLGHLCRTLLIGVGPLRQRGTIPRSRDVCMQPYVTGWCCFCLCVYFRPTFRYLSIWTCLIGFLCCMTVTFLISAVYAAVALVVAVMLVVVLYFRSLQTGWGKAIGSV